MRLDKLQNDSKVILTRVKNKIVILNKPETNMKPTLLILLEYGKRHPELLS
jgi:hypothetical protein